MVSINAIGANSGISSYKVNESERVSDENSQAQSTSEQTAVKEDKTISGEENLSVLDNKALLNKVMLEVQGKLPRTDGGIEQSMQNFQIAYQELKYLGLSETECLYVLDVMSYRGTLS